MYENNGGTVIGVAGADYAILATDTRLSKGYSIKSRKVQRMWEICPGVWLGAAGCYTDALALVDVLESVAEEFKWSHGRQLNVEEVAQALSSVLYQRRGMPYYAFCVLAGTDQRGRGALFTYDAVGSFERVASTCVGGGQAYVLPMLDSALLCDHDHDGDGEEGVDEDEAGAAEETQPRQGRGKGKAAEEGGAYFQAWQAGGRPPTWARAARTVKADFDRALGEVKKAATAAAERDIRLGDFVEIAAVIATRNLEAPTSMRISGIPLKGH